MKFKVGDRVQRGNLLLKGEIMEVVTRRGEVTYDILWEYPGGKGWAAESGEGLEIEGQRVAVPRALLEDIGAMLCHNKFREHDALRTAIGLLLETK